MYILNGQKKEILSSDFIERFVIVEKPDAVLIVASYNVERKITIGKYADLPEARKVLNDMLAALTSGQSCYEMPESSLFYAENAIRDARTRRRDGS